MYKQEFEFDIPKHKFDSIKSGYLTFLIFENENYCIQKMDILKLFKVQEKYEYSKNYLDKNDYKYSSKEDAEQIKVKVEYVDYSINGYVVVGINAAFLEE